MNVIVRIIYSLKLFIFLPALLILFTCSANAQNLSIIRDAETENFLYDLTHPIFKAAHLNPENIKIYIISDSSINAFVAGGQNVFINTGLITKYNRPDTLIGVIAHETGHIAAGHLARSSEEMKNINNAMIFTYIAAIAAAIAQPDAAMALLMGGNHINERLALKYNRTQEEAADLLALHYLDKINYSPKGLIELLEYFGQEEAAYTSLDEYALTHPVSKKRLNFLKSHLRQKGYNNKVNESLEPRMARIVVKLESFLQDPDKTLRIYAKRNDQLAKYARSIAYFKKGKVDESIKEIDGLISLNPNDGYLWELKGQILFESGKVRDAVIIYKKAVDLQKKISGHNPALARLGLASSLISLNSGDKELTDFAIKNLQLTLPKEKDNPMIFKELSNAYSQNNNHGRAYLALAEYHLLMGDKEKSIKNAELAKKNLDKSDKIGILEAEDILATTEKELKKKKMEF
jgi:predicted Zn-dependent protease